MTSHRQACSLSGTLKRCHFDANRKVQLIFLALICQFCKARCVNQIVELFELGDFQISLGYMANQLQIVSANANMSQVDCWILRRPPLFFFSQLVMNEVCFQLDVHAESKWNWDGEMQDVSICYKVHRSTGSISTVQSLQIIVDHRSKMQSQLFAHWNICLTGRKHDVLALQAL